MLYREPHSLLVELTEASLDSTSKAHMEFAVTLTPLIIDGLGMRKLPLTAAKVLLVIITRRC